MYHAFAASLRSAAPGRQVGAAVVDGDGSILATGTNDVARAGGGLYWTEDPDDAREHVGRTDLGDIFQQQLLADLVDRMKRAGWLRDEFEARATNELVTDAVTDEDSDGKLAEARVFSVLEYGRAVHAEMTALLDAARRGVPTAESVVAVTTFPCHECARHIVAAGVETVVYIEPYPKSLVKELFRDSVVVDDQAAEPKVLFTPFVGASPRRFPDLFGMRKRKLDDGALVVWDPRSSTPAVARRQRSGLVRSDGERDGRGACACASRQLGTDLRSPSLARDSCHRGDV